MIANIVEDVAAHVAQGRGAAMTPEQQAAVLADGGALRGAMVIRVAPPETAWAASGAVWPTWSISRGELPAKYRADVLKLERPIATKLHRFFVASSRRETWWPRPGPAIRRGGPISVAC